MSKLRVLTLVSLLLMAVAAGCSSSDQSAIDKAVSATLKAAQPATATSTAISTPEPLLTDIPASEPTAVPTPKPTSASGPTATLTVEAIATPVPTSEPTATSVPVPVSTPTPEPTATSVPVPTPTLTSPTPTQAPAQTACLKLIALIPTVQTNSSGKMQMLNVALLGNEYECNEIYKLVSEAMEPTPTPTVAPKPAADGTQMLIMRTDLDDRGDRIRRIYVMDSNGSNQIKIHKTDRDPLNFDTEHPVGAFTMEWPSWSPDGDRVIFQATGPTIDYGEEFFITDISGSETIRLTNDKIGETYPKWSPSGGSIAFSSNRESASNPDRLLGFKCTS